MSEVEVLSREEAEKLDLELASLYGLEPTTQHSNAAINSLFENFSNVEYDSLGNRIIKYEDFLRIKDTDESLAPYRLRMKGWQGIKTIEASKFHKFWGQGWRPVLETELEAPSARTSQEIVKRDEIVIYYCNVKYAGCPRFFDSVRARETHWGMTHEKKARKRTNNE